MSANNFLSEQVFTKNKHNLHNSNANFPREIALILQVDFDSDKVQAALKLQELQLLTESAGAEVAEKIIVNRSVANPKFFIGSGKVEEIKILIAAKNINLLIVNHNLSPAQERNLERELKIRVIDRNALILDIFAQRAVTADGRLQVELAQLQHLSTRLVRGWTHLERQKGGIGLRGPGESQLETDRRLLNQRIIFLKQKLAKLSKQRRTQNFSRFDSNKNFAILNVAFIGYTNTGKSTLFNALTKANVYSANQLFATLDTTARRLWLADSQSQAIVADTVGFIRDLPHSLINAFHATLEATCYADVLLHVIDFSSAMKDAEIKAVNEVLQEINNDIGSQIPPQILVFNKIDLAINNERDLQEKLSQNFENIQNVNLDALDPLIPNVYVSAKQKLGLENLKLLLAKFALQKMRKNNKNSENDENADFPREI